MNMLLVQVKVTLRINIQDCLLEQDSIQSVFQNSNLWPVFWGDIFEEKKHQRKSLVGATPGVTLSVLVQHLRRSRPTFDLDIFCFDRLPSRLSDKVLSLNIGELLPLRALRA